MLYGKSLYKYYKSLFASTMSILSYNYWFFNSILALLNSYLYLFNISGIAKILKMN